MNHEVIIEKTAAFVREKFEGQESGHDWWHILRVWNLAKHLAAHEKNVDKFVVELGALLHDISDSKFHENEEDGIKEAEDWLLSLEVEEEVIAHVLKIIQNISFKGGLNYQDFDSPELQLLKDADRLDAIGAIGIARTFSYGGYRKRPFYDPELKPRKPGMSKEAYRDTEKTTTINHFYEKLLTLKDGMHTQTAKKMAIQRHAYIENFLEIFYQEWEGKI
ncbi:MAG: HD domain-containing protein [Bernardetiaceae bacterium]|nr:HD domain-containing protein [Bernardetiaceae bacterium]